MFISKLYIFLLLGYVSLSTCTKPEEKSAVEEDDTARAYQKRQTQQQYHGPTANNQQPPQEYLEFLQNLQTSQHQQQRSPSQIQQLVATPQQSTRQYYQPTSNSAYTLHQTRLNSALNPNNYQQQSASDVPTASSDIELQRQAALNAQQAALNFRQSYEQRGPHSQVRFSQGAVKQLQPTYTTSEEDHQVYQSQPKAVQQTAQVYQPKPQAAPSQSYSQAAQQQQQAAIQALYQQQYQQVPQNSPSLQAYQQQANIAEQAALAFQQAIQQQSKTGATGQRPRLSAPQYILEQQHSYVVPNTKDETSESEEYNLAALQQAYQQIETANHKQQASLQRQPQRLVATPTQVSYQHDQEDAHNVGDGDGFEFAKQSVPATKKRPVLPTPPPTSRTQVIRQRLQPQVVQQQQYIQPQVVQQQYVQPQAVQTQQQYVQPQYIEQQAVPEQPQPVQAVPQRTRGQSQRSQAQRVQPQTITLTPSYKQTYEQPEIQTTYQQAVLPTPIPETPKRQRIQTQLEPVQPTVQIPSRAKPQQYYSTESKLPAAYSAAPSPLNAAIASQAQLPGKVGNIDLNLLRSLYAAAESLAITQKGEINPISEDDLIKALLAQGRREQQAADIIQTAAKQAPAPPPEEKDVVRIPTPKNQRPITQDELQALIDAGYDVRPVGEPKPIDNNEDPDPIKAQYLRQAQFLEQQLALKNIRANTQKRGTSTGSRRTRGGQTSRRTPATEEH